MRIDVVGKQLEITPAIRSHVETKADKLTRYYDGLQQVTATISPMAHSGNHKFKVEIVADVEKHADFVAHGEGEDLYAVIDQVVEKVSRQLTDFKEKLKLGKR